MPGRTSQRFPLLSAYAFMEAHGLGDEAEAIRLSKGQLASYNSTIRRGRVIETLQRHELLDVFIESEWPVGLTQPGRRQIEHCVDVYQRFLAENLEAEGSSREDGEVPDAPSAAERNPYEILGIARDAETEVIAAAYRALARKYHPDTNRTLGSEDALARMTELNWAKDELLKRNPQASSKQKRQSTIILSERPFGWEYLYFSQLLTEELAMVRHQQQEAVRAGKPASVSLSAEDFSAWIGEQMASLVEISEDLARLLEDQLPVAVGPQGSPGDPEKIRRVVSGLGDAYRTALSWPHKCRAIDTDARMAGVQQEFALITSNMIEDFESFAKRNETELPDILRRAQGGEEVIAKITMTLRKFDDGPLNRELQKVREAIPRHKSWWSKLMGR